MLLVAVQLYFSRFFIEWMVDRDGITANSSGEMRFVPVKDIVGFQYNPWVEAHSDGEVGHGGCIEAILSGRSLSGDSLRFGRGLDISDAQPILTHLLATLPVPEST
jgi:hypothetical protein